MGMTLVSALLSTVLMVNTEPAADPLKLSKRKTVKENSKMKKTILILLDLILVTVLLAGIGMTALAAEEKSCGDSATYTVDGGTVTIKGTGSINAEAFYGNRSITEVHIEEGITGIDHHAFGRCTNLKYINIPASVTSIGAGALAYIQITL